MIGPSGNVRVYLACGDSRKKYFANRAVPHMSQIQILHAETQ